MKKIYFKPELKIIELRPQSIMQETSGYDTPGYSSSETFDDEGDI